MDPAVDRYIEQAAPFARPILTALRQLVHQTVPDVREQIKWGHPFFCLNHNLCFMAAFKAHCGFGFWRADALGFPPAIEGSDKGMGQFGKLTTMTDLPAAAELQHWLKLAATLDGTAAAPLPRRKKPQIALELPTELAIGLAQTPTAEAFFRQITIAQQNDYIAWLCEAKSPATQQKRLETILLWLTEHKTRNWKYMK